MFIHLLIITLNVLPAGVSEFSLHLPIISEGGDLIPGKTISFAKKKDAWTFGGNSKTQIQIDGVECVITDKNGRRNYDLKEMLGIPKNTDWKKTNRISSPKLVEMFSGPLEVALGIKGPLEIERKRDGIEFFLQRGQNKLLIGHAVWRLGD